MNQLTLPFPDDWHCHLRDHAFLHRTVTDESARFQRAIVMPNLSPPITSVKQAEAYRQRILAARPPASTFIPLMTLYLTDALSPTEIHQGKLSGLITACKLYPAGATTHSEFGIKKLTAIYPLFEAMQRAQMPLLIHAESTDPTINILDREAHFIETALTPLIHDFPELRIVMEHISSKVAVEFIQAAPPTCAATITPHHLLLNLNDLLDHGIHPHYYCKPILKQIEDQQALIQAAISGNPKFFLGTDSAPHSQAHKECSTGCAGIYSAHAAIELYAELFERHQALDKLANFASQFGAQFYQLPVNTRSLTLIRKPWQIPLTLSFGKEELIPLFGGHTVNWQIVQEKSHDS